jgi:hypothetical protein
MALTIGKLLSIGGGRDHSNHSPMGQNQNQNHENTQIRTHLTDGKSEELLGKTAPSRQEINLWMTE